MSEEMNIKELIKKYAEELDLDEEQLFADYNKYLREHQDHIKAFRILRQTLRRRLNTGYSTVDMLVLGYAHKTPYDWVARMKQRALRVYNKDKARAIAEGLVDEDGTPLDFREELYGRPNPNFGKPLMGSLWIARYHVLIQDGENIWVGDIELRNEIRDKVMLKVSHWYTVLAKRVKAKNIYYRISTNAEIVDKGMAFWDDQLYKVIKANDIVKDWSDLMWIGDDYLVWLKGFIEGTRVTKNGNIYYRISNIESLVKYSDIIGFPVNPEVCIIDEGTMAYFYGRIRSNGDNGRYSMNIYGIIPLRDYFIELTDDKREVLGIMAVEPP